MTRVHVCYRMHPIIIYIGMQPGAGVRALTSWSNYLPPFYGTIVVATFLLCPKNEYQQSVNDIWPCILENAWAVWWHYPIIAPLAAILGNNSCINIATISYNECQRRVYDIWPCIMDNPRAVRRHETIITLSAAFLGQNSCHYIATMFSKWVIELLAIFLPQNAFNDIIRMHSKWLSMEHQQIKAFHHG